MCLSLHAAAPRSSVMSGLVVQCVLVGSDVCVSLSVSCIDVVQRGRNVEVYLKDLVNSTECAPQASGSALLYYTHTHTQHTHTHSGTPPTPLCSLEAHTESPTRAAAARRELERHRSTQEANRDKADRCGGPWGM